MWKAIINWINSKAYRCEHEWEFINETEVFSKAGDALPYMRKFTYVCGKCCDSKIVKT